MLSCEQVLTENEGERTAITFYLVISIALELVFWLVPKFVVSAIAVALLGFFTGPLFPGALVVAARLLRKHLHVPGIGLASSLAGGGGAMYVDPLRLTLPVLLFGDN
jgi:fucose permease